MCFGANTSNSPMVTVWPSSHSRVILSQRMAIGEADAALRGLSAPARVAILDMGLRSFACTAVGSKPSFVYSLLRHLRPRIRAAVRGLARHDVGAACQFGRVRVVFDVAD
ncbi:hypothetical protein FIBSPDRAFT_455782 [Athelia psychrophila]|uniref:Uncharacterized protein n=1 Tax=Athelia psychrophila TaxID=1759441 RepID=A0A166LXA9_9AGAM|nr:hypothetical protein FIBSPDRAFT_455782 [Fibularhizoctonia sp. CBS 109695]